MTPKQRSLLSGMRKQIRSFEYHVSYLEREMKDLIEALSDDDRWRSDFSPEEVERLYLLNRRLRSIQDYLIEGARQQEVNLAPRVADPCDPLDDYEIEATLYFTMREDNPEFDEDDDNLLTEREISLRGVFRDESHHLVEEFDWRGLGTEFLDQEAHCYLFHDLYDHSHGLEQAALTLQDCLRIGSIWVDIAVHHQATLDIDSGVWIQPEPPTADQPITKSTE